MANAGSQSPATSAARWAPTGAVATKIALGYAVIGALWIISSDQIVHHLITNGESEVFINTCKGWFFVGMTALLLWFALNHYFRQIRRAARLLQESEQRWQFALDGAGHGVWDWNAQTNQVFYSTRFKSMLGFAPDEFGDDLEAWKNRVHPDDLAHVMTELQSHVDGRTSIYVTEHRIRCKDGSYKWILDQGKIFTRTAAGKPLRAIGPHTDINDRKLAEAALKTSEERFRRVVESAPEAIFIRTGATFAYVNAAALKLFGATTPEQLLGQSVLDRFHAKVRATVQDGMQQLDTQEKSTLSSNRTILRLGGEAVPVVISAVPFNYQEQKSSLVFARDMTAHKQLEAQLRQAQKLEAIGQLAGGVAHDFNNILAATMMHLGLLQMNPALDAATHRTLKELEEENRRAVTLTRQLLMFSRRSALEIKPLDLNELVANLLKMLTRLIGENIDLRSTGQAGLPLVEADAGMLEQVLMNLIVNARDALPQGGRIAICTTAVEIAKAQADRDVNRRPGRFVCLAVSDTGCGMNSEILKHIFEPFFTTKEAGKGTGLGLATVHGIVAQHNGWVEVDSKVGHGTTFAVFLPAASAASSPAAAERGTTSLPRGVETILLVEDDAKVRQTTGQFLRILGYRVIEASNGLAALTVWEEHGSEVDLLLTDMIMPEGMTGAELTEQLQSHRPGLKIIITSGYSTEIAYAGVPRKPGVIYLPKPHETKKLADTVRRCLDQKN